MKNRKLLSCYVFLESLVFSILFLYLFFSDFIKYMIPTTSTISRDLAIIPPILRSSGYGFGERGGGKKRVYVYKNIKTREPVKPHQL